MSVMTPMHAEDAPLTFLAAEADAGRRLDVFLADRTGVSRARIQRCIDDGDASVNGRPARASHRLRPGDAVECETPESVSTDILAEDLPLAVVYEDADLLVVEKPAGQVTHPAAGVTRGTLANALAYYLSADAPGRAAQRPGLAHRLDRDTSGVMAVAKTEFALESLADQFRTRTVGKRYVALTYGRVDAATGAIDAPLDRDRKNRLKMAVCAPGTGRAALSLYAVRRRYHEFTLLDVEIKTGRTHQIRVHCAHIGHPVVADALYGGGRENNVRDISLRRAIGALGRHFLHAAELRFAHPRTGAHLTFASPLPPDLVGFLAQLEAAES